MNTESSHALPVVGRVVSGRWRGVGRSVTISTNFTKRRQNGFKIGRRDKYATHLRKKTLFQIR